MSLFICVGFMIKRNDKQAKIEKQVYARVWKFCFVLEK